MTLLSRLSIRWRITLGSLLIAAVFFGGAGAVFRLQVDSILHRTASTLLANDAEQFENSLLKNGGAAVDEPGRGQLVAVVSPTGVVEVDTLPRMLAVRLDSLLNFDTTVHTIEGKDDSYLVRNAAVKTKVGTWHVVTARNQEAFTILLDQLSIALLVAAGLLLVGFGVASWLLTAAALRPVTRMRRQAEVLSARGSTEPLATGPARDELSALATTLNEFILQLRLAAERERQMVSDASHELRTPIAILKTQLELAHLAAGDAVALEAEISAAEHSVERLARLANGLLELSQVQAGSPDVASPFETLAAELASSVDRARLLAASTNITVDFEITGDVEPLDYPLATENFGRLVRNLTANAITALGELGSVRVGLSQSGTALVLTVSDDGPGMPPDFIPAAFDRFSRPDEARNAEAGGGLGLAIVHSIVTAAGGTVVLENQAAGGLRVTVTVPAVTPQ
ncbi:sensor histidine kinase [Parafrigoribacterium soli]|uniref:sensor histidine kinase n=1 Tax=Parafrigoribacterium soli TaxID=3144663 RepID=UPI0032F06CFC